MAYDRTDTWKTMDVKALGGFIQSKFKEMEKMSTEGEGLKGLDADGVKEFQDRNADLTGANDRLKSLKEMETALESQKENQKSFTTPDRVAPFANGGGADGGDPANPNANQQYKSLGELFCASPSYTAVKDFKKWDAKTDGNIKSEIDGVSIKSLELGSMKATMTTSAGWAPYPPLSPRPPVMIALRRPVVADLIPQDDTSAPAILWYEETTFTNAAATVAEGGTKPEGALGTTLRTQPVVKIAVTLPVTDEQLADIPQVRGYIDQRLTLMVQLAEETGLLNGNGVSPNLMGFHSKAGLGSITRAATEDNPDAILRAITDVNSIAGFANCTGIILHPLNWLAIRLLRTKTGDYIWGHPAIPGPATLWGLPVVATPAQTANRGLVGDFQMYAHISRRLGLRIDVGYINDDFVKDIQRIRLEERLSLEIYRASAFEEILGLNQSI